MNAGQTDHPKSDTKTGIRVDSTAGLLLWQSRCAAHLTEANHLSRALKQLSEANFSPFLRAGQGELHSSRTDGVS